MKEVKNKEKKELKVKDDNDLEFKKIEEALKKQKTLSKENENRINRVIFHNIAIANIIMIYFIFLILGFKSLSLEKYIVDLQVFSGVTLGISILVFEKAYKKDSTEYAIHGIETLFLAVASLTSIYIISKYEEKFVVIMLSLCYLFAIYYVAKSIIVYKTMKQKLLKKQNDVSNISKK